MVVPLLLLLAYLGFVSVGLPDGMLGVAWPAMRDEFDAGDGAVGLLLVTFTTGYVLSSVCAGFLVSRVGVGRLLAASTTLAAAALTGFAVAGGLPTVAGASALLGVASGAIDAGLNAYAARQFGARHMTWLHASYSIGTTVGPLVVTGALAAGWAWRGGYAAVAGAQLLLAAAFALTVRAWRPTTAPDDTPAAPSEPALPAVPPGPVSARMRLLRSPPAVLSTVAFGCYVGVEVGTGLWAFTVLTEARGLADGPAGVAVSAYWGCLFTGRLLLGIVADRLGVHRVLRGAVTGLAVGAALVAVPAPAGVTVAGLVLLGLAAAPVFPLLMLTTAERVGAAHADRTIGLQVGAAAVGGAAAPAGIGLLVDAAGPAVLGTCLGALVAGFGVAYQAAHRGGTQRGGTPVGGQVTGDAPASDRPPPAASPPPPAGPPPPGR